MSGGSLGVNVIYVGGNVNSQAAGTGVFNQTGGTIGSFIDPGHTNNAIGLEVGGMWNGPTRGLPLTTSNLGTYTLGSTTGVGAPLFVGGVEGIGINGTGTFTQNCGTNCLAGGGDYTGNPGATGVPYNSSLGALVLGWYAGKQSSGGNYHGNGVGTYNLTGGLLTGGPNAGDALGGVEIIGQAGTGIFNQTGGTNYCTFDFDVAGTHQTNIWNSLPFSSSYGIYTLSNGLLTGAEFEECGRCWYGDLHADGRHEHNPSARSCGLRERLYHGQPSKDSSVRPGRITSTAGCSRLAKLARATLPPRGIEALPPSTSPAGRSRPAPGD